MTRVRPVSNGQNYAQYVSQEAEAGEWAGRGAERLHLAGEVSAREFAALRCGKDPKTGETLRRNMEDRVYEKPWGEKVYKAREFYEITVSAPKSVSIQGIVDPEVVNAHVHAVEKIMQDLEHVAQEELVMAAWQHGTSRAGDPQLHTHIAVLNVAHDKRGWHALHASVLFQNQRQFTAEYRAALLGEIERKGYRIKYPEIAGISDEMRAKYSQRTQQKNELIEWHEEAHGMQPGGGAIQAMVLSSRPPKDPRTARQIAAEQYDRLAPAERAELVALATESGERRSPYVAPEIQAKYGGRVVVQMVEQKGKTPHLVIRDGGSVEGSAEEEPEWSYGKRKRGPGMGT